MQAMYNINNRAKLFGWPNTYVFTKAMGEMCMGQAKDELPIVIIRPTMVTSTYKEPFPGWIEGLRYLHVTLHTQIQICIHIYTPLI